MKTHCLRLGICLAALPWAACAAPPAKKIPASLAPPSSAEVTAEINAQRRTALVTAAEKCAPAVVTINAVQTIRRQVYNPLFSPLWQDFFRDFMGPPFQEYEEEVPSMGSGFIFDPQGYILTAEHVVHGADKITVTLADGRTFPATWIGSDYARDVAVLKIEAPNLPSIPLGDSAQLMIGEWAIAIGNPFGHVVEDPTPTVSVGVVSALHRQMKSSGQGGLRFYEDLIQTDASINPGNSGGPLVNALGQAIGINVTIITTSGGSLGIGFAVPVNVAREVSTHIIDAYSPTPPPWLGVYGVDVTPAVARSLGLPSDDGVLIADMDENGPAFKVNLRRGDVILQVDGKEVNDVGDLDAALGRKKAGETVALRVRRGAYLMEGNCPLVGRPGP